MGRIMTRQIFVGGVAVGGGARIPIQSMTFSKTKDIEATAAQFRRLETAGCDIVRVAVKDKEDAAALKELKTRTKMPIIADIHFQYRLALEAAKHVDGIRINPGNIGSKERIHEVVKACKERSLPIRIGVNSGSLEKRFLDKYGTHEMGLVQSAMYNISLLEDFDFSDIKVSLKASDVARTIATYSMLRPITEYPFHLGVTEAGSLAHSTIKSSMALGNLLMAGIGDTLRVSITGELENEVRVARDILKYSGVQKEGISIISCPTCGRIESDLVSAIALIEARIGHIKTPLTVAVMGCAVNALGEARDADIAIAFGAKGGLIIRQGENLGKFHEEALVDEFVRLVEELASDVDAGVVVLK